MFISELPAQQPHGEVVDSMLSLITWLRPETMKSSWFNTSVMFLIVYESYVLEAAKSSKRTYNSQLNSVEVTVTVPVFTFTSDLTQQARYTRGVLDHA